MTNTRILFVIPPGNQPARQFAASLEGALPRRTITITTAGVTGLLFEIRKHDLVHFFLPASARTAQLLAKIGGKTKTVQTLLSQPAVPSDYKSVLIGDAIVVFSESSRGAIEQHARGKTVNVIPPCIDLADPTKLESAASVREKAQADEKMLVIALNDVRDRKEFDSLLYITREFNRREVFRFVIPQYKQSKETLLWRNRLRTSVETEKLTCASLLEQNADIHSLLDATDMAVYFGRAPEPEFEFPLTVVEALLRGKPVICFDQSPVSEYLKNFNASWIARNTEDFVRESRDVQKQEARLEEISTELTRYARSHFDPAAVAAAYDDIFNRLLVGQPAASK